jgi:hypothetical protein
MPERTPAGIDGSLHPDIDRQARRHGIASAPVMPGDDLPLGIEYRMRKREFNL